MSDLVIEHVYTAYDQADVLSDISLTAKSGEITCILGANGAGKTTLIRSILGLTPPRRGSIRFGPHELERLSTHQIIAQGIGCVPEGRRVFARMTVEENLRAGAYLVPSERAIRERLARIYETFPPLRERARQLAGTMSGGEQAMISIGRGLMMQPKLLMFDEPSLGLSPLFVQENFHVIRRINATGITILLVEQNVNQTLAIAHHGYVLAQGRIVAQGATDFLASDPEVQRAYFGKTAVA
jgi:branched-chain amino acid transport system ATP-binding protein